MKGLHLIELICELFVGTLKELLLGLKLFKNVLVNVFLLSLIICNIWIEALVERKLHCIVIVNILRHIIHSFAVSPNIGLIAPNLCTRICNLLLHLLLTVTIIINCQTKSRVDLVEMLELAVKLISLLL